MLMSTWRATNVSTMFPKKWRFSLCHCDAVDGIAADNRERAAVETNTNGDLEGDTNQCYLMMARKDKLNCVIACSVGMTTMLYYMLISVVVLMSKDEQRLMFI